MTNPFATNIVTKKSIPELDQNGTRTGNTLKGAVTVELTQEQANLAARANTLWTQGGTTADPVLNVPYPDTYGFGALRCAIDNLNGDNVEWISYPQGARHVYCYAYYVKPPPTSGKIIVRKEVDAPAGTASQAFTFNGNISYNPDQNFSVSAKPGAPGSTTFYRAAGDRPWTFRELVPAGWSLTGLACTSANGTSTPTTDLATAQTSVVLAAGDTVTCTYTNRLAPPPAGLQLAKTTIDGTGSFGFDIEGPATRSQTITTTVPEVLVPGPLLELSAGAYTVTETLPDPAPTGRWQLDQVLCNGQAVEAVQPVNLTLTAGQGTACSFTNRFIPAGTIRLRKATVGATGTVDFVLVQANETTKRWEQTATTAQQNTPALATGDDTSNLELGTYDIVETTPTENAAGFWTLETVICNGKPVGSAQGRIEITLTSAEPDADCTFTNRFTPGAEPPNVTPPTPDAPGGAAGGQTPAGPNVSPGSGANVSPAGGPFAELAVTKTVSPKVARPGQPVRYTVTVRNRGPHTAYHVVGAEVNAARSGGPLRLRTTRGTCRGTRPAVCRAGALAPGQQAVITVDTIAGRPGRHTNLVAVATSTGDRILRDNVARATLRVVPRGRPRFTG